MRVTVDQVGRIVIPKQLRLRLGIGPDTELEIVPDGGGLRLEPLHPHERPIEQADDGFPLLGAIDGALLTDDDVRRMRDEMHR